jgi:hypothetical protein
LRWRRRNDGQIALWVARPELIKRGYLPRTQRVWPQLGIKHRGEPSPEDVLYIQTECRRLQDDMLAWANGGARREFVFDGTIHGLIEAFRRDEDSPYQNLRFASRKSYETHMRLLEAQIGPRTIAVLTARDFKRWFEAWADGGETRHIPRAHARISMLRILLSFGVTILEDNHCMRLSMIVSKMQFTEGRPREEVLTAAHAVTIRRRAHEVGRPSLALAQALQFELMLRPKDVVGEWLPLSEPGTSAVMAYGRKWMLGVDWREVSPDLILTHRLSKSLRGRRAISDPRAGKIKRYDLKLSPMVMEEISKIPVERRVGPMIIDERTRLPYFNNSFRDSWRRLANDVGVPKTVQNRDSRAGGITEGIDASDGDLEANRHAAGHSQIATTQRYSRAGDRQTAKIATLRAAKRPKNDPRTA